MSISSISILDRYRGCLLAGAAGDALGAPIEFMTLAEIRKRFGARGLTDFSPAYGRIGAITDDTQLTLFTAEGLLRAHVRSKLLGIYKVEECVNHAYLRWLLTQGYPSKCKQVGTDGWLYRLPELHAVRAPGRACVTALQAKTNIDNLYSFNDSKGCGGVMRVAPVGLMFRGGKLDNDIPKAFDLGCRIARLTHGHPSGYLAAGVMAALVLQLVAGKDLHEALPVAMDLLNTDSEEGLEVWGALTNAEAYASSLLDPEDAIKTLGGGWVAEEALAIAVYCCLRASTLEGALIMAVNHSGDSDTTGAIAGNIMGAWCGVTAIPERWLAYLELRDVILAVADDLYDCGGWSLSPYEETPETKEISGRYPGC